MMARYLVLIAACIGGGVAGGNDVERIAILGCLRQNEPAPALEKCLQAKPDLCLWIGDNVYADTATAPDVIRDCYATLAAKPGFAALRAAAPWVATWDDHDFGCNDGGGGYPLKRESRNLFREFWRLEREIPEDRDGVYFATTFPAARRRLVEVIRRSAAEHLVFLTGDQHYGEVCRLPDALGYDAVELQFSGVNQIEAPEFNSTRVTPVSRSRHSFALLDIRWTRTAQDLPHLLIHVVAAETGLDDVVYRVNFAELERSKAPASSVRAARSPRCISTATTGPRRSSRSSATGGASGSPGTATARCRTASGRTSAGSWPRPMPAVRPCASGARPTPPPSGKNSARRASM